MTKLFPKLFVQKTILAKLIEELAVWLLVSLVVVFSLFPKIWELIPLMQRFATIPWLLFIYTYTICSKYEGTHKLDRNDKTLHRKNYQYALWWGFLAVLIHYIHLPYTLEPSLLTNGVWSHIEKINSAYIQFQVDNGPSRNGVISAYAPWLGLAIALIGAVKISTARIRLNGYWAIDIYTYKTKHELVKDGPYKFIRHPIYIGQIYLVLGTTLVTLSFEFLLFLLLTIYLNIRRANTEEEELCKILGQEYETYQKETSKMFAGVY